MTTLSSESAPRARRLLCVCYDALLLAAVLMGAIVPLGVVSWSYHRATGIVPAGPAWSVLSLAYLVAVVYGYFALCWRTAGQTLAMKTWRIRLICDRQPMPWRVMAVRVALVFATTAPLVVVTVVIKHLPIRDFWLASAWAAAPYLWCFVDPDGLFLHDRLAGTRLVSA